MAGQYMELDTQMMTLCADYPDGRSETLGTVNFDGIGYQLVNVSSSTLDDIVREAGMDMDGLVNIHLTGYLCDGFVFRVETISSRSSCILEPGFVCMCATACCP